MEAISNEAGLFTANCKGSGGKLWGIFASASIFLATTINLSCYAQNPNYYPDTNQTNYQLNPNSNPFGHSGYDNGPGSQPAGFEANPQAKQYGGGYYSNINSGQNNSYQSNNAQNNRYQNRRGNFNSYAGGSATGSAQNQNNGGQFNYQPQNQSNYPYPNLTDGGNYYPSNSNFQNNVGSNNSGYNGGSGNGSSYNNGSGYNNNSAYKSNSTSRKTGSQQVTKAPPSNANGYSYLYRSKGAVPFSDQDYVNASGGQYQPKPQSAQGKANELMFRAALMGGMFNFFGPMGPGGMFGYKSDPAWNAQQKAKQDAYYAKQNADNAAAKARDDAYYNQQNAKQNAYNAGDTDALNRMKGGSPTDADKYKYGWH